jgi:hypothetical protein
MSNDLFENLFNGEFNLTEIYNTFNQTIDFEGFCRNNFLNHFLTVDNSTNVDILIQALCQLNLRNLTLDLNTFINDLNYDVINKYVRSFRKKKSLDLLFFSLEIFLNY